MTLLNKLLSLYHTSLRTLCLRDASVSHFFPTTSRPLVAASHLHPVHLTLEPRSHPPSSTGSQIPTPRYARTSSHSSSRASQSPPSSQRCSPHSARTLRSQRSRYQHSPQRTRPSSQACLESLRMEHPYAAVPPLSTHLRYAALAPAPAVALLRQEMSASAVDGRDGCAGGRRLERLSVMLWRGYGPTQSSAYVETCLCPTGSPRRVRTG
jgi:hypothetical protein